MRNKLYILLILLIAAGGCSKKIVIDSLVPSNSYYRQYGAGIGNNFYIPNSLGDSLEYKWTAETSGSYSPLSFTCFDSLLFAGDLSGNLYSFNYLSGKELGVIKEKGAVSVSPVLDGFKVYYILNNYKKKYFTFFIYDYYNGDIILEKEIKSQCDNEMLIFEDGVVILAENGTLLKYSKSGEKLWSSETLTLSNCHPASDGENIILGNIKGELISVKNKNGKINYRKDIGSGFESGISVMEGHAYAGDNEGFFYCVNIKSGELIWKINSGAPIKSPAPLDKQKVYIVNLAGRIIAADRLTGEVTWDEKPGGLFNAAPVVFDDRILVPDLEKRVFIMDKNDGKITNQIIFERRVKMTPLYYRGRVYFGVDKGEIICYQTKGMK